MYQLLQDRIYGGVTQKRVATNVVNYYLSWARRFSYQNGDGRIERETRVMARESVSLSEWTTIVGS